MNYIWPLCAAFALLVSLFNGSGAETAAAALEAAGESVKVVLSLAGMLCFWSGILEIADRSGLSAKLEKLLSLPVRMLFPKLKKGSRASKHITENIAANLLGVGNAATPAGIAAMNELDKLNPHPEKPTAEMCIFTVLNTASLQLIPTTIISMRASAGAARAADIIPAVWISSVLSLLAAVISMKIILHFGKD